MPVTFSARRIILPGLTLLFLLPFYCHARSDGVAEIDYRGEKFKLTKSYSNYDDYKNDPDNIDPAEIAKIERLMSQVKIGPEFSNWADFAHQAFAIKFPGYGFGSGPKVKAAERQFQVTTIEIPRASEDRYFVMEKFADGRYRLVDDFVTANRPGTEFSGVSSIELVSDELVYFDRDRRVVRSAKVSGQAHNLHIRDDGTFDVDGQAIPTEAALEDFLRERRPARIHVIASKKVSYKKVEEAMTAIQRTGVQISDWLVTKPRSSAESAPVSAF